MALVRPEEPEHVLWSHIHPDKQGSSSGLATRLKTGLEETGHVASEIDHIVISQGPGSFTGIKAGLAFTLGFSSGQANAMQWSGLSSLEAGGQFLREKNLDHDETLWFFLPSTKTHGYLALCTKGESRSFLVDIDSMRAGETDLRLPTEKTHIIFASPWAPMEEKFLNHHQVSTLKDSVTLLDSCLRGMIRIVANQGTSGFSLQAPEPKYLRKSTVEERMDLIKEKK